MNTLRFSLVIAALLLAVTATSNAQDKPKKTFLSALKEGQVVSVKEVAGKFDITVMKNAPVGSKVLEIGSDFVVLEDAAGVLETRIHVTSIKSIIRLKLPKE
jgi:hypothetical protein